MNPAEVAERGVELVETIKAELGDGWTKLPGLAGERDLMIWDDDTVALGNRDWSFYLIGDELWSRIRRDEKIWTGRWHEGEFEATAVTAAPDPSQN